MLQAVSPPKTINIESLGLDQGAHLLIKRALDEVAVGGTLRVASAPGEGSEPGAGWTWARLLADLGEADANVAHVFRNHLAFVEDRLMRRIEEMNASGSKQMIRTWSRTSTSTLLLCSSAGRSPKRW